MQKTLLSVIVCLMAGGLYLVAQEPSKSAGSKKGTSGHEAMAVSGKNMSTDAKIKLALSAGPADIGKDAAVVEPGEGGKMNQLRAGTNGWLCMPEPEPMCLDKEWQGWADAWMNKKD